LADVLRQIGCTQAAEILTNSATEAQAKQRIAEGADCFGQFEPDRLQAAWISFSGSLLAFWDCIKTQKAACTFVLKCAGCFHITYTVFQTAFRLPENAASTKFPKEAEFLRS
jgi:hypothetical protein